MRATFPIITCDAADGCDQWTLDWYTALVTNWRECMAPGWVYDPHRPDTDQLCPEHAAEAAEPNRPAQDPYGRQGSGPFCEETWQHRAGLLVCQRGPQHVAEGRDHKDTTGLLWSDAERAAGVLR